MWNISSENWYENSHSPQRKRQRVCPVYASRARFIFSTGKNMAAPQRVYIANGHASNHVKPWRVKMRMQIRVGRKEHKNNERCHWESFLL